MSLTLTDVSKLTEDESRETFERIRWPQGPVCPHCGSVEATKLQGKSTRSGVYKCRDCEQQFTATVNTILEDSHLPIRTWLMAFALLCSAKKGVSALQLQRQLDIGSYRSAWHMAHRIRHAMSQEPLAGLLGYGGGVVEVDEFYAGATKVRKGTPKGKRGRGTKRPTVVALVERGGRARAHPIERVDAKTLKAAIRKHADKSAAIHTDELPSYKGIGKEFDGGHHSVNHSAEEFSRDGVTTNSAESYFALLRRGLTGSFHHVSEQHLHRYCSEFSFRWDHRKVSDSERTEAAIQSAEGKRLLYRDPIGK